MMPSIFIPYPQIGDFSSSKLGFRSLTRRTKTRLQYNRYPSSPDQPPAQPPLLETFFFSSWSTYYYYFKKSILTFPCQKRLSNPPAAQQEAPFRQAQIAGWRRPQLYPLSMTRLGLQWFQTKKLKCMKVSVSSRQNLKIPAWDAGWELFPTTGLQAFPAGSLRACEFFLGGCRMKLVITGVTHGDQGG